MNTIITSAIISLCLCFAGVEIVCAQAAPSKPITSKDREIARCEANLKLCNDVADIDRNNCAPTGTDCVGEYLEDKKSCAKDYNDCLGSIAKIHALELKFEKFKAEGRF